LFHRRDFRFWDADFRGWCVRGRHPKPTALKVLQGNPGKRALPKDEPTPTGKATKPKWLKANKGGRVWDEYAPIVDAMGLLTDADTETFARWCVLAAEFRKNTDDFTPAKMARMDSLEQRFGLDPSARARLGGAGRKKPKNSFAELSA
jgi:phage terminase small subunit